jgi:hypothetical protein
MVVPLLLEVIAVALNVIQKESVQKPDVLGVISVEGVEPLQAGKEGPPCSGKVTSTL